MLTKCLQVSTSKHINCRWPAGSAGLEQTFNLWFDQRENYGKIHHAIFMAKSTNFLWPFSSSQTVSLDKEGNIAQDQQIHTLPLKRGASREIFAELHPQLSAHSSNHHHPSS